MFANIVSPQNPTLDCRIKAEPYLTFDNFIVYELVDSIFPNSIKGTLEGEIVGVFRHIALDTNGVGYLFDVNKNELALNLGQCSYIK
ncbi:hypothetical protein [Providencia sp. PROV134]|uniref:hypothetical protein n=1 Tax=Providencia sp. PROV134 TaxID=2949844 RepID=UPI00234B5B08|nr:hypothetical protein [Providencia sp. PROV134]